MPGNTWTRRQLRRGRSGGQDGRNVAAMLAHITRGELAAVFANPGRAFVAHTDVARMMASATSFIDFLAFIDCVWIRR